MELAENVVEIYTSKQKEVSSVQLISSENVTDIIAVLEADSRVKIYSVVKATEEKPISIRFITENGASVTINDTDYLVFDENSIFVMSQTDFESSYEKKVDIEAYQ